MDAFVDKQIELLALEKEEEINENGKLFENVGTKELQRRGVCLLKLRIASRNTGLYGRSVLRFEPFWPGQELPSHKINCGDIVGVYLHQKECGPLSKAVASGVVVKGVSNSVHVAFEDNCDELDLDDDTRYQLIKLTNEVSYRRIKGALRDLKKYSGVTAARLIDVLFGDATPSDPLNAIRDDFNFVNKNLDNSQQEAVKFALCQKEIAIVHGPPGTGKTTTVIEIILQCVKLGQKVLACAPSNVAVDNLVEKLSECNVPILRIGHPARILNNIQRYSLDALLSTSSDGRVIGDVRKEIDDLMASIASDKTKDKTRKLRREAKFLYKELRNRETKATRELIARTPVILSTLTSAYLDGPLRHVQNDDHFNVVVIDECSQGLEAACWIPLLRAPKCVLAGDHLQLPPTIVSKKAAREGLELTLMERLLKIHGDSIVRMLTVQYRMHAHISRWSSDNLYDGKLTPHFSVAGHLLKDLPHVNESEDTNIPLLLIDTAGCDINELDLIDEASKGNEGEADIVAAQVRNLVNQGVRPDEIAVITPYNLQVDLLRLRLSSQFPKLEIRSVDGFQGREKEAVIMSLVRSNREGKVGFLAEVRRINVAVTRARRHVTVVCDSETVSRDEKLKSLIDYLNNVGEVRSAHQYEEVVFKSSAIKPNNLQYRDSNKTSRNQKATTSETKPKSHPKLKIIESKIQSKSVDVTTSGPPSDRDAEIARRLREQIESFLEDESAREFGFPATLSSFERRIVHEIAESKGLNHFSSGEGDNRHVVIKKKLKNTEKSVKNTKRANRKENSKSTLTSDKSRNDIPEAAIGVNEQSDRNVVADTKCDRCGRFIPKNNLQLHLLRCSEEHSKNAIKTNGKTKAPKNQVGNKLPESEEAADDFDNVLEEFTKCDRVCNFVKCKTPTVVIGVTCKFCRRRFCLHHGLAEIHGCGAEARLEARRTVIREGVIYPGSGVPSKKPDAIRRINLEKKLDKKIAELANQRKTKKKD